MPLLLFYQASFFRTLKSLGPNEKKTIKRIVESLEVYYSTNCNLESARKLAPRFFYKQLQRPYSEAGIDSKLRVILWRQGNTCRAVFAGNHDQVRRFLKNV